jgi:predicted Fe-Mo cluster-binding NifX family protein
MRVCIPVAVDGGSHGAIFGHFASAPYFEIVDTDSGQSSVIANCDPRDPYAGCDPFAALHGLALDGVIAGGVGDEAVRVMNICGYVVYQAVSLSVAENLALFEQGGLAVIEIVDSQAEGRCGEESDQSCNHQPH